jgi:hypothetical protein
MKNAQQKLTEYILTKQNAITDEELIMLYELEFMDCSKEDEERGRGYEMNSEKLEILMMYYIDKLELIVDQTPRVKTKLEVEEQNREFMYRCIHNLPDPYITTLDNREIYTFELFKERVLLEIRKVHSLAVTHLNAYNRLRSN